MPESRSRATGFCAEIEELVDHTVCLDPLTRTRIPGSMIFKTPDLSGIGVSLLATQTTVPVDIFLYHIPTYRFLESGLGLKNPNSKVPEDESMVLPSVMKWVLVIAVSMEIIKVKKVKKKEGTAHTSSIDVLSDLFMGSGYSALTRQTWVQVLATEMCFFIIGVSFGKN